MLRLTNKNMKSYRDESGRYLIEPAKADFGQLRAPENFWRVYTLSYQDFIYVGDYYGVDHEAAINNFFKELQGNPIKFDNLKDPIL